MGEVYDIGKARQTKPMPLPDSLLAVAGTLGLPLPHTFERFYLRRCKEGTEVHIKGGKLTLNLSYFEDIYPENFRAARKWIAAVATRYGWQLVETKQYF